MDLFDARMAMAEARARPRPATRPSIPAPEPDAFAPPPDPGPGTLFVDFETDGVDWRNGHRPGGAGIRRADGSTFYLAWGHRGGGNNVSPEGALRWFREHVRDRKVANLSTGFEVHMSREWGHDLERANCTVTDVAHTAALVDDQRRKFSLEALAADLLPESERKVTEVGGVPLDPARMMEYPARLVAVRAEADVRQAGMIRDALLPKIGEMGLERVQALEDAVIFAACEMEKNALPIDREKLARWAAESEAELDDARREVSRALGREVQEGLFGGDAVGHVNPDSPNDMIALFKALGLDVPTTSAGRPTFASDAIAGIDHPTLRLVERQSRLLDLRAKFLLPYLASTAADGLLKFRLHQCKNSDGPRELGTKRGRFSASDHNIQQVMRAKKQREKYGPKYIVRELIVGGEGRDLVSADARQIEYRIFGHYLAASGAHASGAEIVEAYRRDPYMDFHERTTEMVQRWLPSIDRQAGKTLNFLTVYGGGTAKLALALGLLSQRRFDELFEEYRAKGRAIPQDHPELASVLPIRDAYRKALPGVAPLGRKAMRLAEERGYVKDILGRRATFPGGAGAHAALNAVIQPSAAEVMKIKMVEAHRARHAIGFVPRATVHDELLGDALGEETPRLLRELLDVQSIPFRVPILWDVNRGRNWAECK